MLSKKVLNELRRRVRADSKKKANEPARLTHLLLDSKSSGFKSV
jgi:hypothetical protein